MSEKKKKLFRKKYITTAILIGVGIAIFGFLVFGPDIADHIEEALAHFALVLLIIGLIHLLDHWYIHESYLQAVKGAVDDSISESSGKIQRAVREESEVNNELLARAHKQGIIEIYHDRDQATSEIKSAVQAAKSRLLILGVALSENISREDILQKASELIRSEETCDVRVLMMDATRSPAIHRGLLESDPGQTKAFLARPAVYKDLRIFGDFHHLVNNVLKSFRPLLDDSRRLRFYGQSPLCLLVVADNDMFYQPYSFGGRDDNTSGYFCIGNVLPMFRMVIDPKIKNLPNILVDHFDKLWNTSDMGLAEAQARLDNSDGLLEELHEIREEWLNFSWKQLYEQHTFENGTENRRWIRHEYHDQSPVEVDVTYGKLVYKATLNDYGVKGLNLSFANGSGPPLYSLVRCDLKSKVPQGPIRKLMHDLFEFETFKVTHVSHGGSGLAAE